MCYDKFVSLLLNLVLYTLSILVIAPIAIALCPGVLATFCLPARWFIVVGAVLQLALAGLFLLLLVRPGLVERIALWCLDLLSRGRLRLRAEQWRAALAKKMPEYRACTQVLRRDWRLLAAAFCCNLLQRLSLLLVPVCLLLGSAGSPEQALRAAAIQACIILGSNAAPLPGAMGVADFLFLDGYGHLTQDPVSMELASRRRLLHCLHRPAGSPLHPQMHRLRPHRCDQPGVGIPLLLQMQGLLLLL